MRIFDMSLEKSIKYGKEYRKPYYGSKSFDMSCRKKTCPGCMNNAMHSIKKKEISIKEQIEEKE
jgi:hypothetical protein